MMAGMATLYVTMNSEPYVTFIIVLAKDDNDK
jgi:hypothetical protein